MYAAFGGGAENFVRTPVLPFVESALGDGARRTHTRAAGEKAKGAIRGERVAGEGGGPAARERIPRGDLRLESNFCRERFARSTRARRGEGARISRRRERVEKVRIVSGASRKPRFRAGTNAAAATASLISAR